MYGRRAVGRSDAVTSTLEEMNAVVQRLEASCTKLNKTCKLVLGGRERGWEMD